MSAITITLSIAHATVGQAIGIKEAIAMDLEKYGDVRVVGVEVQEAEQMTIPGTEPHEREAPEKGAAPAPQVTPPGPAEVRSGRYSAMPPPCCLTCAHYRSQPGRDDKGTFYWGPCKRSGRPVYRLGEACKEWEERISPM